MKFLRYPLYIFATALFLTLSLAPSQKSKASVPPQPSSPSAPQVSSAPVANNTVPAVTTAPQTTAAPEATAPPVVKKVVVGKKIKLSAPEDAGEVTWTSSNPKIATVSSAGKVKGKKAGTVTITAAANGQTVASYQIKVQPIFSVNKKKITLKRYKRTKVTVTFRRKKGTVYYKIKDKNYLSGKWGKFSGDTIKLTLQGRRPGKTTVIITNSFNKEKKKISVTVK